MVRTRELRPVTPPLARARVHDQAVLSLAEIAGSDTAQEVAELAQVLAQLSPDASLLLEVAAVWGPSFSLADLAEVLGRPGGTLLTPLPRGGGRPVGQLLPPMAEVIGPGVLAPTPDGLTFPPGVIQEAVYQAVP